MLLLRLPLLLAVLLASAAAGAPPADPGKLAPELDALLAGAAPPGGLRVLVALRSDDLPAEAGGRRAAIAARRQRVVGALGAGGFQLEHAYGLLSGVVLRAGPAAIEALAAHPEVVRVYPDGLLQPLLAQGRAQVGADLVEQAGFTGAGVRVAVLDTGIDTNHSYLADDLVEEQCFCDHTGFPGPPSVRILCCPGSSAEASGPGAAEDDDGHGTSVSGIITSSYVLQKGVAPGAEIVAVRVIGPGGAAFSDVDKGLDWVLANQAALDIRVVNMSFGSSTTYDSVSACRSHALLTSQGIQLLEAAGVSVFAASGNDGVDDGISFPACEPSALAVGGVYDGALGDACWCGNATCTSCLCEDVGTSADMFVCHTNSGSLLDLLAPDWRTSTAKLGGGLTNFGGTSASAPYAAAQAALLYEADPTLAPADVRGLLLAHGPLVTSPDNGLSFRRSNVAGALTERFGGADGDGDGVYDDGDGSGTPGDAPCAPGAVHLCDDSCPADPSPGQEDADGDGVGDACDTACGNGQDDDGDGWIDYPEDPGCAGSGSAKESTKCQDGLDNDGDDKIDFDGGVSAGVAEPTAPDPQCSSATKDREAKSGGSSCGLGAELVLLLLPLQWLRRRSGRGLVVSRSASRPHWRTSRRPSRRRSDPTPGRSAAKEHRFQ